MKSERGIADKIREWLSPILIAVLGMYGNSQLQRLDTIELKIDQLMENKAGGNERFRSIENRLEKMERNGRIIY